MKTKIFTTFSLLIILLASCAFNEKSSGKSSLSFSIPQETLVKIAEKRHVISPSLNYTPPRIYKNEVNNQTEETETLKITAELTGSSSGTQTKNSSADFESIYKTSDISFTFSDLDSRDTYKITVNVYDSYFGEDYLIYTGTTENIELQKNQPTTVTVKLSYAEQEPEQEEGFTTSIVLYNKIAAVMNGDGTVKTPANYAMYKFDKDFLESGTQTSPTKTFSEGKTFTDFVIDTNDFVYYTDGEKLYCEAYEEPEIATLDISSAVTDIKLYKDKTGLIFYAGFAEGNIIINAYDVGFGTNATMISEQIADSSIDTSEFFDFATNLEKTNYDEVNNISVYEGYIYIAVKGQESGICFVKIPMKYTANYNNGNYIETIELENTTDKIESIKLSEKDGAFTSSITAKGKITDMILQNEYLYALFSESSVQTDSSIQEADSSLIFKHYARGALIRISPNNFTKEETNILGDSSIASNSPIRFSSEDGNFNMSLYQATNNFFGPQKFIAIKPKKLVISDDGRKFFYDEEKSKFCYKNINQVIIFDEETSVSTAYTINATQNIKFDTETTERIDYIYSGSPYTNDTVATCENADEE
ncbi:MAG: hypothetical protein IJ207_10630 [Treponema sp.]|uniref:hypothetical protein n=1 Tax=Treponema sp. TaxID=166 RepID=UPI0025E94073|nr:hypothetical protein [Treponema sp.]MBQ9282628.1 hypothetical protein [Treponema sp.]